MVGADTGVPPFDPKGCKFDLSTFSGRLAHFRELVSPTSLLISDAMLQSAEESLRRHGAGEATGLTDAELWNAKRIRDSAIHPATGEKMFLPGRMAAFMPMNTAVTAGMLLSRSPLTVGLSQWANQTVNTMVNYVNRSGASCDTSQLAQAYVLACSVACGIGVGASKLVERGPPWIKRLGILVPYTAVVSAGAANLALTRLPEIRSGAPIASVPDGEALGSSSSAAVESVRQVLLSRICMLPIMPMILPPLALSAIKSAVPLLRTNRPAAIATEVSLIASSIYFCLPAAIAVFPQEMVIPVSKLEPEFQGRRSKATGAPVEFVTCNKGL